MSCFFAEFTQWYICTTLTVSVGPELMCIILLGAFEGLLLVWWEEAGGRGFYLWSKGTGSAKA